MYIRLCLLLLGCALVGKTWHVARDGFRLDRCQPVECVSWGRFSDAQSYRYLASGRQFYAFESLDGQFVVKLPRTDIYRLSFWHRVFPHAAKQAARAARKAFFLESLRIAAEEIPEQTGLLAITSTEPVHLIDRLGRTFTHQGPCVWQRKMPLLIPQLKTALQKDRTSAERMLAGLSEVLKAKETKGILTKDAAFFHNFGFDGKQAYELDVGSFCHAPGGTAYARRPICQWLAAQDPSACRIFEECTR